MADQAPPTLPIPESASNAVAEDRNADTDPSQDPIITQGLDPLEMKSSKPVEKPDGNPGLISFEKSLARVDGNLGDLTSSVKELVDVAKKGLAVMEEKNAGSIISGYTSSEEDIDEASEDFKDIEFPATLIPEVRLCNWDQFKNRYSQVDGAFAIEALMCGDTFNVHKEEENVESDKAVDKSSPAAQASKSLPKEDSKSTKTQEEGNHRVQRVRINSKAVLKFLGSLCFGVQGWDSNPHTFLRPFRYFIHYHDKAKEKLEEIEGLLKLEELEKLDKEGTPEPRPGESINVSETTVPLQIDSQDKDKAVEEGTVSVTDPQASLGINGDDDPETPTPNPESHGTEESEKQKRTATSGDGTSTIVELRCYMAFVEKYILPDFHSFDDRGAQEPDKGVQEPKKVRFADLSSLFRLGEIIHITSGSSPRSKTGQDEKRQGSDAIERLARAIEPRPAAHDRSTRFCTCPPCMRKPEPARWDKFAVGGYYVDYDGNSYVPRVTNFEQNYFEGEVLVTSLDFYPLRFNKDADKILAQARSDGAHFAQQISDRYGFYNGWTLIKGPQNEDLRDAEDKPIKIPEHVESHILVDFAEAFNTHPSWWRRNRPFEFEPEHALVATDPNVVKVWSDSKSSVPLHTFRDLVVTDDRIANTDWNWTVRNIPYFKSQEMVTTVPEADLGLLARRMFAYAMWERKWVHIDSRYVQLTVGKGAESEAFKMLQIDNRNKTIIESLIHSHFKRQEAEQHGVDIGSQDLIRGKGKGVIILLHGAPGVGKTATAEAIAQKWKRPLFPITCGDLGTTPASVESTLNGIFRLAHLWGCVLLLDEADVFIAQRDRHDLLRNALVSVFLRMLEYYNGILFLTTNRVGVVDEAIKSRVHLTLHYDHLDESQTVEIFKINIERLKKQEEQQSSSPGYKRLVIAEDEILKFAQDHYRRYTGKRGLGRWNGRQIRNAFVIASSLAHFEAEGKPDDWQKQLRTFHFETVDETTLRYDKYRENTLGLTDTVLASDRAERGQFYEQVPSATRQDGPQVWQRTQQPQTLSSPQGPVYQPMPSYQPPMQGPGNLLGPQGNIPVFRPNPGQAQGTYPSAVQHGHYVATDPGFDNNPQGYRYNPEQSGHPLPGVAPSGGPGWQSSSQ